MRGAELTFHEFFQFRRAKRRDRGGILDCETAAVGVFLLQRLEIWRENERWSHFRERSRVNSSERNSISFSGSEIQSFWMNGEGESASSERERERERE